MKERGIKKMESTLTMIDMPHNPNPRLKIVCNFAESNITISPENFLDVNIENIRIWLDKNVLPGDKNGKARMEIIKNSIIITVEEDYFSNTINKLLTNNGVFRLTEIGFF